MYKIASKIKTFQIVIVKILFNVFSGWTEGMHCHRIRFSIRCIRINSVPSESVIWTAPKQNRAKSIIQRGYLHYRNMRHPIRVNTPHQHLVETTTISSHFRLLDKVQGRYPFIILSFVIRIVEAMGNAAFLTASFAIIAKEFPNNVATTFVSINTTSKLSGQLKANLSFTGLPWNLLRLRFNSGSNSWRSTFPNGRLYGAFCCDGISLIHVCHPHWLSFAPSWRWNRQGKRT